ncbi:24823_t:CDS:2, partial [Dentiscutata erythropus]
KEDLGARKKFKISRIHPEMQNLPDNMEINLRLCKTTIEELSLGSLWWFLRYFLCFFNGTLSAIFNISLGLFPGG